MILFDDRKPFSLRLGFLETCPRVSVSEVSKGVSRRIVSTENSVIKYIHKLD